MSGNSLVIQNISGNVPAVFGRRRGSSMTAAAQANVQATFAVISYKGRNWRIKYRGEEEPVMDPQRPDAPAPTLDVIVVGCAEHISKQWFARSYVEGSDSAPDCFSLDGITPDVSSPQRQNPVCHTCPHNQWGSRMTQDGRKAKSCQDSRRVAVVPAGDIENEVFGGPMLLRIPPMSLGNLATYAGALSRRNAPIEGVVTRLGFDWQVAYPQLTFSAERWVTDGEADQIVGATGDGGICAHPLIHRLLYDTLPEVSEATGAQEESSDALPPAQPAPAPAPAAPPAAPAPAPAAAAPEPAPTPAPTPAPAPAAAPAPRRRTAGFAAPAAPGAAPVAQAAAAPAQPNGAAAPPQTVAVAPANMQQAIDDLLKLPVEV